MVCKVCYYPGFPTSAILDTECHTEWFPIDRTINGNLTLGAVNSTGRLPTAAGKINGNLTFSPSNSTNLPPTNTLQPSMVKKLYREGHLVIPGEGKNT
ncbi:MAG TPA: hypothetical protein VJ729_10365 [Nitrososphaeraceae archaeon]|nr:hypothetical protein [Nitrososphaeraceae archaeon]